MCMIQETGGLFRVAVKLMMACATTNYDVFVIILRLSALTDGALSSDYVPLVNLFGIYFQIRDDYMNLQSSTVSFIMFYVHDRSR